jgi:hypothetical protein
MTRDRMIAVFVVLTAATVGTVVVWLVVFRPAGQRTTVRDRTTVLVEPVLTPLRDSGPHNNKHHRRSAGRSHAVPVAPGVAGRSVGPQNRSLPSKKRRTARTRPDHRRTQQRPKQPAQPSNPPSPPPSSNPAVCVNAPVPLTVTTPALGINNCR